MRRIFVARRWLLAVGIVALLLVVAAAWLGTPAPRPARDDVAIAGSATAHATVPPTAVVDMAGLRSLVDRAAVVAHVRITDSSGATGTRWYFTQVIEWLKGPAKLRGEPLTLLTVRNDMGPAKEPQVLRDLSSREFVLFLNQQGFMPTDCSPEYSLADAPGGVVAVSNGLISYSALAGVAGQSLDAFLGELRPLLPTATTPLPTSTPAPLATLARDADVVVRARLKSLAVPATDEQYLVEVTQWFKRPAEGVLLSPSEFTLSYSDADPSRLRPQALRYSPDNDFVLFLKMDPGPGPIFRLVSADAIFSIDVNAADSSTIGGSDLPAYRGMLVSAFLQEVTALLPPLEPVGWLDTVALTRRAAVVVRASVAAPEQQGATLVFRLAVKQWLKGKPDTVPADLSLQFPASGSPLPAALGAGFRDDVLLFLNAAPNGGPPYRLADQLLGAIAFRDDQVVTAGVPDLEQASSAFLIDLVLRAAPLRPLADVAADAEIIVRAKNLHVEGIGGGDYYWLEITDWIKRPPDLILDHIQFGIPRTELGPAVVSPFRYDSDEAVLFLFHPPGSTADLYELADTHSAAFALAGGKVDGSALPQYEGMPVADFLAQIRALVPAPPALTPATHDLAIMGRTADAIADVELDQPPVAQTLAGVNWQLLNVRLRGWLKEPNNLDVQYLSLALSDAEYKLLADGPGRYIVFLRQYVGGTDECTSGALRGYFGLSNGAGGVFGINGTTLDPAGIAALSGQAAQELRDTISRYVPPPPPAPDLPPLDEDPLKLAPQADFVAEVALTAQRPLRFNSLELAISEIKVLDPIAPQNGAGDSITIGDDLWDSCRLLSAAESYFVLLRRDTRQPPAWPVPLTYTLSNIYGVRDGKITFGEDQHYVGWSAEQFRAALRAALP